MDLSAVSEIVSGLVLQRTEDGRRRCNPDAVDILALEPPFDKLVRAVRDGLSDAEIIQVAGMETYRRAMMAGSSMPPGTDVSTYLDLLHRTAALTRAGAALKKAGEKMLRGDEVDVAGVLSILDDLEGDNYEWVTMDQVEPVRNIWKRTYWDAWDENFNGIPRSGVIIVGAPPGVGKTSLCVRLMDDMTAQGKKVGFLSLEMEREIVKMRWLEIHPDLPPEQARLMRIADLDHSLDEAYASIARLVSAEPDIYAIFIDYAQLMLEAPEETDIVGQVYLKMAKLARKIHKPIFLLSQLSRNYVGGLPHVSDIRYSGMAEATAVMIVLLYNPDQLFVDMGKDKKEQKLPYVDGKAYVILGKSRYGFKMGGVGAFQTDWSGAGGWGRYGDWYRL